jgi:hypothetical protein
MAKKQSFGDKVKRKNLEAKRMAQIVIAEKKSNGHYRFKSRMVEVDAVKDELKAARS